MAVKKQRRAIRSTKKTKGKTLFKFWSVVFVLIVLVICGLSFVALGYTIFFQVAQAAGLKEKEHPGIVYEEPNPPLHSTEDLYPKVLTKETPPKVALIIDDMGYDEGLARRLLDARVELNYSFLPFAPYTRKLEGIANKTGKTVMLHLPLEPRNYRWDPGPATIYLGDSLALQKEKFKKSLAQVPHAIGVNNHMGSRFTEDEKAMRQIMSLLVENGLFFVDSFTTSKSVGYRVAGEMGVRKGRRQVFIDNELDEVKICSQLEKLILIAERRGEAIGIGHPHRATVDALEKCLPIYEGRVDFVSVLELL